MVQQRRVIWVGLEREQRREAGLGGDVVVLDGVDAVAGGDIRLATKGEIDLGDGAGIGGLDGSENAVDVIPPILRSVAWANSLSSDSPSPP